MATIEAEVKAVNALRDYLLRTLPAKCASINTGRAAVLKAPRAGPYTIPASGSLKIGAVRGSESTETLTSGSRTASQVAAELSATGVTASADSQGRLVLTSDTAPTDGTPSVVSLGADSTATNAVFGWSPGGEIAVREAVVTPTHQGIRDGDHHLVDVEKGFGIIIGEKRTTDTMGNIRYDQRDVTMRLALYVRCMRADGYSEQVEQCVRAVREVIFEDRTLDAQVQMTEVLQAVVMGPAFLFANESGASPLLARADMNVRVRVFERS
jgi:hypothetical protein